MRIDFPGHLNGFACDLVALAEEAIKDARGHLRYEDLELVVEVISQGTGANDYGPKKQVYAAAEVPVYLIVDPYQGKCHVYSEPKEGVFLTEMSFAFGQPVDLTRTPVGLILATDEFPRD